MRPLGSLSFSEVQDLCAKAARGAGLDWGLAEEAGFAARWLYARGLDGPGALLGFLEAESAENSPLGVGTAISDRAATVSAVPVRSPLLILPFLFLAANELGRTAQLVWQGNQVFVTPTGVIKGHVRELASEAMADVSITFGDDQSVPIYKSAMTEISPKTISALTRLAMETTVPATAASRADAGAGGGDND
jgi:hypothetical protein